MALNRSVIFAAPIFLALTAAVAQQPVQTAATTACNSANRGTVNCPTYTAPVTTSVRSSMDGSMVIPSQVSTPLFNGAVPPNGFMIEVNGVTCVINDNGPANVSVYVVPGGSLAGFQLTRPIFITPTGYKPMGPVSAYCTSATYIAARGW